MNPTEEWNRIKKLEIADVKLEIHNVKEQLKHLPSGGNSTINMKLVMLQTRMEMLEQDS